MKSNTNKSEDSLPRESSFNPYGSYMMNDDKFGYSPLPSIDRVVPTEIADSLPQSSQQQPQQPQQQDSISQFNEAESLFAYFAQTEDNHELPELEFPVPAPDIIPDMVFENENNEDKSLAYHSENLYVPPELSTTNSNSSSSHSSPTASHNANMQYAPAESSNSQNDQLEVGTVLVEGSRIPIQSSYVAYARAGVPSVAAVQDRRARNTQSARRSRARRADKLVELREENAVLMFRNDELTRENAELKRIIEGYESTVRSRNLTPQRSPQRSPIARGMPGLKPEIPRSPYETF